LPQKITNQPTVHVLTALLSGHTEPVHYSEPGGPAIKTSGENYISNGTMFLSAVCQRCRTWLTGSLDTRSKAQPMIYAIGPGLGAVSDDLNLPLRRHIGVAKFTMDMVQAAGEFEQDVTFTSQTASSGAAPVGAGIRKTKSKASTAHGVIFVLVALAAAPFDTLVAGALRRWPALHAASATVYLALVIGALVPGVMISKHYIAASPVLPHHSPSICITNLTNLAATDPILQDRPPDPRPPHPRPLLWHLLPRRRHGRPPPSPPPS